MAYIQNTLSNVLAQASRNADSLAQTRTLQEGGDEADSEKSQPGRNSFSGSGLSLDLELASGQKIDLEIRINQAGGISRLELDSRHELDPKDQQKLQSFLDELAESVDALFSGKANGEGLFDFANGSGIKDVELSLYQDDGNKKQMLEFEKSGEIGRKEVEAELYSYDRHTRSEEQHQLKLSRQGKNSSDIYGPNSYQWIQQQIDNALTVVEDKGLAQQLGSFFKSGISALFGTASRGQSLLEELGASAQQAQKLVGQSIKVLATDKAQQINDRSANGLPDFNAEFSSSRSVRGAEQADLDYDLALNISQLSRQSKNSQTEQVSETQNRRLRMEYESVRQQAVYEYTWTRDESIRNVFEKGQLQSSHYRIEELSLGQVKGDQSAEVNRFAYKDSDDVYLNRIDQNV